MTEFGKIFNDFNGNTYAYFSGSNKILTVNSDWYSSVKAQKSEEQILTEIGDDFHLSTCRPVKCGEIMPWDQQYQLMQNNLHKLILEITQQCNLRCEYCIFSDYYPMVRKHSNTAMSQDIARRSIDYYFQHNSGCGNACINFYGGEPLLNWETLKYAVEYAGLLFKNKPIKYYLSSNGTNFTEEVLRWLADHPSITVVLTVNGELHDDFRKKANGEGSLKTILESLGYIREHYPYIWENQIEFIANVSHTKNLKSLYDFYQQNFKKYPSMVAEIQSEGFTTQKTEMGKKFFESDAEEIASIRQLLKDHSDYVWRRYGTLISNVANRKITEESAFFIPSGSCMPFSDKIFVTADGFFEPCEKTIAQHCFGDVYSGLNYENVQKYFDRYNALQEKCLHCWARRFCTLCIKDVLSEHCILEHIPEEFCERVRAKCTLGLMLFVQYSQDLVTEKSNTAEA